MKREPYKDKILYFNNSEVEGKYTLTLINTIISSRLEVGECFEYLPFNYFGDENSDFKSEELFNCTELKVFNIKKSFIETWNGSLRTKIEIYLTSKSND